jgi:sugar lactone lactonase YvrE
MRNFSFRVNLNASPLQRAIGKMLVISALAAGFPLFAQIKVISADNLSPFEPRDVGTTSDAKTVRIKLNYARALTSIAVAPGFTEFTAGPVSGCAVDGHTVNPALSACSLDITFTPKYSGFRSAPLIATDSTGAKSSVGLEGTGLAPQAALTPGIITTVAGNGTGGFSGDGGPATSARLYIPAGVALDAAGNLYIGDTYNNRIRKVDINGIITKVAGGGKTGLGDGGPATSAQLSYPYGVALDAAGNLYIADAGYSRIRKVDINGIITTVAGGGNNPGNDGVGDGGPATSAQLNNPPGVALDAAGNLYIADLDNHRIRKVDINGIITTVAGGGTSGLGDGGSATSAHLNYPFGVALDAAGNLYIADAGNSRIRKVDINGIITTVAGGGTSGLGDGGSATSAQLYYPYGVALDAAGNLYIADTYNNRIRKVDTNGIITTVAGKEGCCFSGDGGPATSAQLRSPYGVALDAAGNLYIADFDNYRIRKVDIHGIITTVAGHGDVYGGLGDGGPATSALLKSNGVALDAAGNLYIADAFSRIRKVDVSQSAAIFGPQNVGTVSPSQQVTVTNTGNQHIELTGLSLSGDFQQVTGTAPLTHDCTDTTLLGAGFSCALRITFAPTAVGSLTGSATVTDNSLSLPGTTQTISLSTVTPPTATLSATHIAFGNQAVGTSSALQTVTVTNSGAETLTFHSIVLGGTNADQFGTSNNCSYPLLGGAACTIRLRFNPTVTGADTASITLTDNASGSPQTVSITGTGVNP